MGEFENRENYFDKRKGGLPERQVYKCQECGKDFIGRFKLKKCKEHIDNKNYQNI